MRGTPIRYTDFKGGVNTKASPYLVGPNECRDCRNVISTTRGSVRKRNGCTAFTTPSTTVLSLMASEATATKYLIGVTFGNDIVKTDSAGVTTSIKGAVTVTTALGWEGVSAPANGGQGPFYMANGIDAPVQWTGSGNMATWTLTSGTIPNPSFLAFHANRVWMANLATGANVLSGEAGYLDPGSIVAWTDIGNPRSIPVTNFVALDPNDGDAITGIGKVGPYLLVFKRRKTFVIFDTDTGANRRISDSVGAASHRSIAESPQGTFFLTEDRGVHITDAKKTKLVSDNIAPTLEGQAAAWRRFTAGHFFNDHYYLSIAQTAASSTFDLTLDYDSVLDSWWFHSFAVHDWVGMRFGDAQELFGTGGNAPGAKIFKCFVTGGVQDDTTSYLAQWTGPWIAYNEPYRRKKMREIHVDGTGVMDAYLSKDFAASATLLGTDIFNYSAAVETWGGSGTSGGAGLFGGSALQFERHFYQLGNARAFSFRVEVTSAEVMEMDAYSTMYTPRTA